MQEFEVCGLWFVGEGVWRVGEGWWVRVGERSSGRKGLRVWEGKRGPRVGRSRPPFSLRAMQV